MDIVLRPVRIEEKSALSGMLDEYLDDLSTYVSEPFPKPYTFLDSYFSEPDRHPFFIVIDDTIVGFALVNLEDPLSDVHRQTIAEFYILPGYRKKGIGEKSAVQIFDRFPGPWIIRELIGNPAVKFWRKVIKKYTQDNYRDYEQSEQVLKSHVQEFTNTK